jgi:hypothetical protein
MTAPTAADADVGREHYGVINPLVQQMLISNPQPLGKHLRILSSLTIETFYA